MKLIIAKHSGFCSGVDRSAKLAQAKEYKKPVYTWGPLIHNQQFVDYLKTKNIYPIQDFNKIKKGTVIIRSHGIAKNVLEKLKKLDIDIIDGTCPNVLRVHRLANSLEKDNYQVIIFGDKNHPEVIGISSYVNNPVFIKDVAQAKNLQAFKKSALISQTTQYKDIFLQIVEVLKRKSGDLLIKNTICNATRLRQDSAKQLAKKVDIMIIIGGKHSSNTKKLFGTCSKITKSHHIETYTELKPTWFKNVKKVGVTAGASTPDWIIKKVLNRLNKF